MAPPRRVRAIFRVMDGAGRLGLRALRREFGAYGEVICAALRADSARQPESVEVEFSDAATTSKAEAWRGTSSDLPLYRSEGLVDALRRDAETSFLCYVDGFGRSLDTFSDLETFAEFLTDRCSATLRSTTLLWSPGRGVFARVECAQRADQERLIAKVATEHYQGQKLSCSAVVGGEYSGVGEGGYRVDWSVVIGEAAMLGVERKDGKKIKKKAKKSKGKKAGKKQKDGKAAKKAKKKGKKEKPKKKKKKEKKKSAASSSPSSSASGSSSSGRSPGQQSKGVQVAGSKRTGGSSSSSSSKRGRAAATGVAAPAAPRAAGVSAKPRPSGPMALLSSAEEDGDVEDEDPKRGSSASTGGAEDVSRPVARGASARDRVNWEWPS